MKYETIKNVNADQKKVIGTISKIAIVYLSRVIVSRTVLTKEKTSTLKNLFGYLFMSSPLWLRNLSSLVKVTLLNLLAINVIKAKTNKPGIGSTISAFAKSSCANIGNEIVQKKNKFALLLLVRNLLIVYALNKVQRVINHIISLFNHISKVVLLFVIYSNPVSALDSKELVLLINKAEIDYKVPKGLLFSIASVESKFHPNAVNVNGKSILAKTPQEAMSIVAQALSQGITNIDIGVMQVNYKWHNAKFNSIQQMLDPAKNITYAAKYLNSLYKQHGSWHKAVRFYHSSNPLYYRIYSRKILHTWLKTQL